MSVTSNEPSTGWYPWQFVASKYGASTSAADNTAALQACITAAATYGQTNGYAEVILDQAGTYVCTTAATAQSSVFCQLLVPYWSGTRYTLFIRGLNKFVGTGTPTANPVAIGPVIRSTDTPSWSSGSAPAILSCGTSGTNFSNVYLCIEGVTFRAPSNPKIGGIHAYNALSLSLRQVRVDTNAATSATAACTNAYAVGITTPKLNNWAFVNVRDVAVVGYYAGIYHSEHLTAHEVFIYKCTTGVSPEPATGYFHAAHFGHLSIEQSKYCIAYSDPGSGGVTALGGASRAYLVIEALDIENPATGSAYFPFTAHICDNGNFKGRINYLVTNPDTSTTAATVLTVTGGGTGLTRTDLAA